jgi:hypothetical protein
MRKESCRTGRLPAKSALVSIRKSEGAGRDFIDVHSIAALRGWSVGRFIEYGDRQLPLAPKQVALAFRISSTRRTNPYPALMEEIQVVATIEAATRGFKMEVPQGGRHAPD